jgi:hypothetical protein
LKIDLPEIKAKFCLSFFFPVSNYFLAIFVASGIMLEVIGKRLG